MQAKRAKKNRLLIERLILKSIRMNEKLYFSSMLQLFGYIPKKNGKGPTGCHLCNFFAWSKKLFERQFVSFQADVGKDVDGAASVYVAGFEPRVGIARELRRLFSDYNHTSWHEHLPGREFQTKCQMLWLVGDLQFACQTNVFHPCAQLCMWCSDTFFHPRFWSFALIQGVLEVFCLP